MEQFTRYTDKYAQLLPALSERARRLVLGADAKILGKGGKTLVHKASKADYKTIARGMQELEEEQTLLPTQSRKPGGGRKKIDVDDPTLIPDLKKLIEGTTRGDPESPLRWTVKSLRTLEDELITQNHEVSCKTVGNLLKQLGYTLQSNYKKTEGAKENPDRNEQFLHINATAESFITTHDPVISVDTKKKELVGQYKNNGVQWLPKGEPIAVNSHDFPDEKLGKAVPYGVFDVQANQGYVNVGMSGDTGEFSVASITHWWETLGKAFYPTSKRLYITADAGGSNGYRLRLWKKELQTFATKSGLDITVSHFPPGTSKWNKIEHKLFSFISINWRGKPLTNYQTIVSLIAGTKTKAGLKVYAHLDEHVYVLKKYVTDAQMEKIKIIRDAFHGEWNYTIQH